MKSILAVCIGNICRSPIAEGLLSAALPCLHVESAGIGALVGQPADPLAIELMKRKGFDISEHIARQINRDICQRAEIIFVMGYEQQQYLEHRYPFVRGKVFRIAESLNINVPDPYQKNMSAFEEVFEFIEEGSRNWIDRIQKINA